jgi:hypothetical protein
MQCIKNQHLRVENSGTIAGGMHWPTVNKPDQAGWHRPARKPDIVHEGEHHA